MGLIDWLRLAFAPVALTGVLSVDLFASASADFDILSFIGGSRATAYPGANKVLTAGSGANRKTFVTWVNYTGSDNNIQAGSRAMVRSFDWTSGLWTPAVDLGDAGDNHGGGTLALDAGGRVVVVYGAHNSPLKFRRTTSSANTQWGAEETIVDYSNVNILGGGTSTDYFATYPSMVADAANADVLHLVFRGDAAQPHAIQYFRRQWTTYGFFGSQQGYKWNRVHSLVEKVGVPDQAFYTEYGSALALGPTGTLHLAYHFEQETGSLAYTTDHVGYMKSTNGGDTWTNAAGQTLSLPTPPDAGPALVLHRPASQLAIGSVDVDSNDHPWLTVTERLRGTFELLHHDGAAWASTDLTPVFEHLNPNFSAVGESQLSVADDTDEIRIAASYLLNGQRWAQTTSETVLLRSDDAGQTWFVQSISPIDPANANWAVMLERGSGHNIVAGDPSILYTHGNWDAINSEVRFTRGTELASVNGFYWSIDVGLIAPGDTDFDGDVDLSDLGNLATHYGAASGAKWSHGDFDRDGDVDLNDLGTLATNYNAGEARFVSDLQTLVPEPAIGAGVWVAICALIRRERRPAIIFRQADQNARERAIGE